MAEARSAVAEPRVLLMEESSCSWRELYAAFRRNLVRSYYRTRNSVRNGTWPTSPSYLGALSSAIFVAMLYKPKDEDSVVSRLWTVEDILYLSEGIPRLLRALIVAFSIGVSFFVCLATVRLYLLRLLLSYQGWMYDPPRKTSRKTFLWGLLVKIVSFRLGGYHPSLYSCQRSLPRMPVPPLQDTIKKTLESLEHLSTDEEHRHLSDLAEDFLKGAGPKLQKILLLKSWWATNYVTDWWEKYVYLMSRAPLAINCNYYVLDQAHWIPCENPVSRAAHIIHWSTKMKRVVDREQLPPFVIRGTVPMCMAQYERMFSTTRIPGENMDEIVHYESPKSRHIVVVSKSAYYKLEVYDSKNQPLSAKNLEKQLTWIVRDSEQQQLSLSEEEKSVAALTGIDRTDWAIIRRQYFFKGVNKKSITAIDKAILILWLSDVRPQRFNEKGKLLLHGDGASIWFDKCLNITVFADGQCGLNCEHSHADAPVYGHFFEYILCREYLEKSYVEDGTCMPSPKSFSQAAIKPPVRLAWEVKSTLVIKIQQALKFARSNNDDLDLEIREHRAWAKGLMKQCKVSPDAFIQFALQLAYYREAGKVVLTYEACMTRLFQNGRTETVRSCTKEAVNFVKAMCDPSATREEKIQKLRLAADRHQVLNKDGMTGKGVDRHLFALYVVSKGLGQESEFLRKIMSRPWTLSTSQQPQQQVQDIPDCNTLIFVDKLGPGGGFGPVSDDGYGISYMVCSDYNMFFHVSSKRSTAHTNSKKFMDSIFKALDDIRRLFFDNDIVNSNHQ